MLSLTRLKNTPARVTLIVNKSLMVISSLVMTLLVLGCMDSTEPVIKAKPPLTVDAMRVSKSDYYTMTREYAGSIQAGQNANLGFELSGKIARLMVDVGQAVEKGQELISLDTQLLDAELKQLNAQLKEIRAQQRLTKVNLDRQYALKKKGFSSESEIDLLMSDKEALEANSLRIDAAIEENRLREQKSTIVAPYSGIVSKRYVSLGDVVAVGAPTLSLLSVNDKEAIIGVHHNDVQDIQAKKSFLIRVANREYPASLISKASNIDINSRTIRLRFLLDKESALLDGELAYLLYEKKYPQKGYWLPNTALIDGIRGTWNVFTLNMIDEKKVVERRTVQVLFANNQSVYVQGALSDGDEVITTGLHKVVSGQIVQVAE